MKRDYALYQVALKAMIRKNGQVLFLRLNESENRLDLPGGRIDNVESKVPLEKILEREIKEELGHGIKYKLEKPLFQFRRATKSKLRGVFNLLTVYEAKFISGKIKLSPEHTSYEWINPEAYQFKPKDFFNKEEYLAFKKYFGQK